MHSSRMRTVHCSGSLLRGGGEVCPGRGVMSDRGRWWCLPRGLVSAQGEGVSTQGVSAQGGVRPGGGSSQGGFAWLSVCPGGVSAQGGVLPGGVCPGGCLPDPHPRPVDRMTDACENITFPQLLLRTVTRLETGRPKQF